MNLSKCVVLCCLFIFSALAQAADVRDIRFWRAPDHSRVVFDLSGPVEHEVITLSDPFRLVVDIDGAAIGEVKLDGLSFADSPIKQLRHAAKDDGRLRVVFDLNADVQARSFFLPASAGQHDRLVIDFLDQQGDTRIERVVKSIDSGSQRDVIIALDAGHGGEDPGAIGPGRLMEKHVVLQIANKLKAKFEAKKGYQVVMIRDGDYYVGLAKRRDLARQAQADFFVSIHADAFTNPQANGSSVYALSQSGATSTSARILAQRENQADLVGGVSLSDRDQVLAGVLTDLSMTATLDASLSVGAQMLTEMGKISRLHSRRVEQAGFVVLKSPDIPSLLVETGFISNPTEAGRLRTSAYQYKMARAIFEGVDRYFRDSPPPGTYFAAVKRGDIQAPPTQEEYVIGRGDTLSGIAQRYNVSIADLKRQNQMSDTRIRVGQKIQIPSS